MDVHFLVFSKDRAAQADLLLRSLAAHVRLPHRVTLLYFASDAEYEAGYARLRRVHPDIETVDEGTTHVDAVLRGLLAACTATLFGILADDNVIIRDVRSDDAPLQRLLRDDRIVCASLRLTPDKTHSQPHDLPLVVPPITDGVFDFAPGLPWPLERPGRLARKIRRLRGKTRTEHGCWGVPFSADGNLYRTERFRAFVERVPRLQHVTSVEPQLTKHAYLWDGPLLGAIYPEERLINLVMNNVDSMGERYPHPGHSVAEANRRYLAGERLDLTPYEGGRYNACHIEVSPQFVASEGPTGP